MTKKMEILKEALESQVDYSVDEVLEANDKRIRFTVFDGKKTITYCINARDVKIEGTKKFTTNSMKPKDVDAYMNNLLKFKCRACERIFPGKECDRNTHNCKECTGDEYEPITWKDAMGIK